LGFDEFVEKRVAVIPCLQQAGERAKRVEESDGELVLRMRTGLNWDITICAPPDFSPRKKHGIRNDKYM
jgi:hypothetical protein